MIDASQILAGFRRPSGELLHSIVKKLLLVLVRPIAGGMKKG